MPAEALDHVESYGTNHVHLHLDPLGRQVDNLIVLDPSRHQGVAEYYRDKPNVRLFVGDTRYFLPPERAVRQLFQRAVVRVPQLSFPCRHWVDRRLKRVRIRQRVNGYLLDTSAMSFSLRAGFNFGGSVVVGAIQLAASRGHTKILLCGVDASFSGPKQYCAGAERAGLKPSLLQLQQGRYNFRALVEPQLARLQIYFAEMGVELIDCSPGGKLRFIRKGHLEAHVPGLHRRPPASSLPGG